MNIDQVTPVTITNLWSGIESGIGSADRFEVAAQSLAQAIYDEFQESVGKGAHQKQLNQIYQDARTGKS